jgi:hypothetical protein
LKVNFRIVRDTDPLRQVVEDAQLRYVVFLVKVRSDVEHHLEVLVEVLLDHNYDNKAEPDNVDSFKWDFVHRILNQY